MEDTTLAVADVVDLLNTGGWIITGGADKACARIAIGNEPSVSAAFQRGEDELYIALEYSTRGIAVSHITASFHPLGNRSRIYINGNRQIQQQRPKVDGGGYYFIHRHVRLLTVVNPELEAEHV